MIKFIATDMDGTLLNSNNEIHADFYPMFQSLKEKDIIFAAASGRQYYNLLERFKDIKDDMMFIAENGTFVVYKGKYYERYKIVEDLTSIDDDILKVTICDFNGSENNSNNYFDEYRDKVQITVSGEIWLDMVAKGINKGVAINEIQNLLNIDYKETMVFGDYLNDLEMMSSAYHSYAMANAHDTLKKAARFIAKSNDENGVIQAIKSVAL